MAAREALVGEFAVAHAAAAVADAAAMTAETTEEMAAKVAVALDIEGSAAVFASADDGLVADQAVGGVTELSAVAEVVDTAAGAGQTTESLALAGTIRRPGKGRVGWVWWRCLQATAEVLHPVAAGTVAAARAQIDETKFAGTKGPPENLARGSGKEHGRALNREWLACCCAGGTGV